MMCVRVFQKIEERFRAIAQFPCAHDLTRCVLVNKPAKKANQQASQPTRKPTSSKQASQPTMLAYMKSRYRPS